MSESRSPLDLRKLKVYPLAERRSLSRIEDILIDSDSPSPPCPEPLQRRIAQCAAEIKSARKRGASVMYLYGAHLVKNGGSAIINRLIERGWITHLATNGAGSIHDWEFAFQGVSTESVEQNVVTGTFGTWDETGKNIHLALLCGGARGEAYGTALGRFRQDEGVTLHPQEEP